MENNYKTLAFFLSVAMLLLGFIFLQLSSEKEELQKQNRLLQEQYDKAISRIDRLQQDLLVMQEDTGFEREKYKQTVQAVQEKDELQAPSSTSTKQTGPSQSGKMYEPGKIETIAIADNEKNIFDNANEKITKLDYEGAIEEFSSVGENSPEYLNARLGIAHSYFYAHDYRRAAEEFEFVLQRNADLVVAAIGLANSYQRLGNYGAQVDALDRAIEAEPGNWLHYNGRATAWLAQGEYTRAQQDYSRAADLAGENRTLKANALENIGIIYLNRQEWQKAFDHADSVNEIEQTLGWNWLFRGIAAVQMERNIDAYVSYDQWFKYKKATDPYLLKQLLPESLYEYIDISVKGLPKLIAPPLPAGDACVNDYQCKSRKCRPGAPDNKSNYCVDDQRDCAVEGRAGFLAGEHFEIDGISVRCYAPLKANPRWTRDKNL